MLHTCCSPAACLIPAPSCARGTHPLQQASCLAHQPEQLGAQLLCRLTGQRLQLAHGRSIGHQLVHSSQPPCGCALQLRRRRAGGGGGQARRQAACRRCCHGCHPWDGLRQRWLSCSVGGGVGAASDPLKLGEQPVVGGLLCDHRGVCGRQECHKQPPSASSTVLCGRGSQRSQHPCGPHLPFSTLQCLMLQGWLHCLHISLRSILWDDCVDGQGEKEQRQACRHAGRLAGAAAV